MLTGRFLFFHFAVAEEVHIYSKENDRALDDILPVGVDAHQVKAIIQDAYYQDADKRSANRVDIFVWFRSRTAMINTTYIVMTGVGNGPT